MDRLRTFLAMLALALAGLAISLPATARGVHGLTHAGAPVANSQHHHHDSEGGSSTHGSDADLAPQSEGNSAGKFGHSHMASTAFDVAPQAGSHFPGSLILAGPAPAMANTPALGTLGWSPQKRPPRTA